MCLCVFVCVCTLLDLHINGSKCREVTEVVQAPYGQLVSVTEDEEYIQLFIGCTYKQTCGRPKECSCDFVINLSLCK